MDNNKERSIYILSYPTCLPMYGPSKSHYEQAFLSPCTLTTLEDGIAHIYKKEKNTGFPPYVDSRIYTE